MPETWKPVPGFPGYEVSDLGRVRGGRRGGQDILKGAVSRKGYRSVVLWKGKYHTTRNVHRLVLEAFVGVRPKGYQCDHINAVRDDNRLVNLRWVTPTENRHNPITEVRCVANHPRKRPVKCIETGEQFPTITAAGKRYGLSKSHIGDVCARRHHCKSAGGLTFVYVEVCHA